mgnify:CR=1 FL=1
MDIEEIFNLFKTPEEKKLALTAIWIRMNDKMNRLKNLVLLNKENTVQDESIQDTFKDLSNYAIIAQLVINDEWVNG